MRGRAYTKSVNSVRIKETSLHVKSKRVSIHLRALGECLTVVNTYHSFLFLFKLSTNTTVPVCTACRNIRVLY